MITGLSLSANICGKRCWRCATGPTVTATIAVAFTDNVSPMNAFKNRYGLIEIDLQNNRARRAKKSAAWFRELRDRRELTLTIDDEWK